MLKVIKPGILKILDKEIPVAVLEGEKRVVVQREVVGLLTGNKKGGLSRYLKPDNLAPYLPEKFKNIPLDQAVITFRIGGKTAQAFEAEDIISICEMYLKARDNKALLPSQFHLAAQAEILMRSFAKVGLIALIDEATGFQEHRDKNALRILVEQYIIEEARAWTKEFYDPFFIELDKIYGNQRTISRHRPKYYGKFINKYIYKPIENGIIYEEIDKLNPRNEKGDRKKRLHQFLTEDRGLRVLRDRISKATAIMQISPNMRKFKESYERLESKQMWFNFPEE
jgi:predicted transcriptional regulator